MIKFFAKHMLLLLLISLILASSAVAQTKNIVKNNFDITNANKTFDSISIKLSTQNLKAKDLKAALTQLEDLQQQAKKCIENAQNQIKEIDILLKTNHLDTAANKKLEDYQYLVQRKETLLKQASACRVFVFRSQEAISAYKNTIQKLTTSKLFAKSAPIWNIFSKKTTLSIQKFDGRKFILGSGINILNTVAWWLFVVAIIISTITGYLISRYCRWQLGKHHEPNMYSFFLATLKYYAIPTTLFGAISLYFAIVFFDTEPSPTIEILSYVIFIFTLAIGALRFLFNPPELAQNPLQLSKDLGKKFFIRLTSIASIVLFGYFIVQIFDPQPISTHLQEIVRTLYITMISLFIIWAAWLFSELKIINRFGHGFNILFKSVLIIITALTICLEWIGFHALAAYILFSMLSTVVLIVITWFITRIIGRSAELINNPHTRLSQFVRYSLGLRDRKKLPEINIICFLAYSIIAVLFFLYILQIWGVSATYVDQIKKALTEGFYITGIKINLSSIAEAIVAFIIILLLGRITSAYVARKHQFGDELDTQVAIATIINYVSFSIAILVALLIAGVDFTGLAIVAGALSVGIGLGLQNIANNVVSGIILLLEKPIKPGDRIFFGETEGYVKRVRIRSTRITTLAKEDVIIPNADLISNKVINYMFQDKHWRVTCKVGVAYGSDIQLVRKTLLEVAENNSNVLQNPPNKPVVLFRQFGDSSLKFELWCIIGDVNKKYHIESELHFAIDTAFRKNHITIAFPQRDIHVKDWHQPAAK